MTPDEKRAYQAEWARKKYRRERGLPEDVELRSKLSGLSEEEKIVHRRRRKSAADRRRYRVKKGLPPDAVLTYNKGAPAKVLAKKAAHDAAALVKQGKARAAKEAAERKAAAEKITAARAVRKPGRIMALCGWGGL